MWSSYDVMRYIYHITGVPMITTSFPIGNENVDGALDRCEVYIPRNDQERHEVTNPDRE